MSRDRSTTISRERDRPMLADRIAARREVAPAFGDGFPRVAGAQDGSPRPLASLSTDELEPTPLFPVERSLSETAPPIDPAELRKFRAVPADVKQGQAAFANTAVSAPVPARDDAPGVPREPCPSDAETRLTGVGVPAALGQSGFSVTQITLHDPREVREEAAARAEQRLANQHPEVARLAEALRADRGELADAYAETQITEGGRGRGPTSAAPETSTERWLRAIEDGDDGPPVADSRAAATPANPWRTAPPTPVPSDPDAETLALLDPDAVTRATGGEAVAQSPVLRSRTGDDVLEVALEDLLPRRESVRPPAMPPLNPTAGAATPSPTRDRPSDAPPHALHSRPMGVAPTLAEQRELAQRLAQPLVESQMVSATPDRPGELSTESVLRRLAALPPLAWVGAITFVALLFWLFTL